MAKRQSELLAEEMEVLRAEVELIAKMTVPDEDAAERAEYDAAQERSDVLRAEWQTKKALYDKARDREKQVDEIMRAHQEEANRELGAPRRGPESVTGLSECRPGIWGDALASGPICDCGSWRAYWGE